MYKMIRQTILLFSSLLFIHTMAFAQSEEATIPWPEHSDVSQTQWPEKLAKTEQRQTKALDKSNQRSEAVVKHSLKSTERTKKTAYVYVKPKPKPVKRPLPNHKRVQLPRLKGLHATGDIEYKIIVGGHKNYMEVKGEPRSVAEVHYQVINGVLHLSFGSREALYNLFHTHGSIKQRMHINLHLRTLHSISQVGTSDVSVRYLKGHDVTVNKEGSGHLRMRGTSVKLTLLKNTGMGPINIRNINSKNLAVIDEGPGSTILSGTHVGLRYLKTYQNAHLTINNINSPSLTLDIHTNGKIKLTGVAKVAVINFSGTGDLKLYWVKSNNLVINTYGSGTLALAGVAKLVNAFAHDQSHLDLRYLRSQTIFVTSYDEASVDVIAVNNLYALAENVSNIYYYNEPKYKTRIMRQSGSILAMHDVPSAILSFNTRGSIKNTLKH